MTNTRKKKAPSKGKRRSKSLLRNQAESLFKNGFITTTLPKAKTLRPYAEKLITKAIKANKENLVSKRVHILRVISKDIQLKDAYFKLVNVWAIHCLYRPGGYLRITKLGRRLGDGSEMALITLVHDETLCLRYNIDFRKGSKYLFKMLSDRLLLDPIPDLFTQWRWNFVLPPIIEFYQNKISEDAMKISIVFKKMLLDTSKKEKYKAEYLDWNRMNGKNLPLALTLILEIDDSVHKHLFYESKNIKIVPKYKEYNKLRFLIENIEQDQILEVLIDMNTVNTSSSKRNKRRRKQAPKNSQIPQKTEIFLLGPNKLLAYKQFKNEQEIQT